MDAMRYTPLSPSFHTGRRQEFARQLPANTVAIIDTNPELVRSRDVMMPFRPDSYFYYLTGIDQPGGVLVISQREERLFIPETDSQTRRWDGERYTQAQAQSLSGIEGVGWLAELPAYLDKLTGEADQVLLNCAVRTTDDVAYMPGAKRARSLRRQGVNVSSARPILAVMRMTKRPEELVQIRRAVEITAAGLEAAGDLLVAGRREYEIEAALLAEFVRRGAVGHAWDPIVASGPGTTVMHYVTSGRRLQAGELVLMDVGAEYGWYSADVSRVYAVGRPMTSRQREVFEVVRDVQQYVIKQLKPGADFMELINSSDEYMTEQLVQLAVVTRAQADAQKGQEISYRERYGGNYYAHGFAHSHLLGLDVHDVGDHRLPLAPGMVLTCEPGIYLDDEGIGVRLEDDILITPDGNENLTAHIPMEL